MPLPAFDDDEVEGVFFDPVGFLPFPFPFEGDEGVLPLVLLLPFEYELDPLDEEVEGVDGRLPVLPPLGATGAASIGGASHVATSAGMGRPMILACLRGKTISVCLYKVVSIDERLDGTLEGTYEGDESTVGVVGARFIHLDSSTERSDVRCGGIDWIPRTRQLLCRSERG
jgi:hypothetical protein